MLLVLGAAALCLLSLAVLRQGFLAGGPLLFRGFNGRGVIAAFVLTVGAAALMGPVNGLSLVLALLLHEAGHWLGLRIIGRPDAEFRLLPLLESDDRQPFLRDDEAVFHALTGSAISVAPMVLALTLAISVQHTAPALAGFCTALTLSLGVLNALNLLPFRLLDGGCAVEAAARVLSPSVLYLAGASAIAGLALTGYVTGLVWTYAVAALGLAGMALRPPVSHRKPLVPREAGLAFTAWAALLASHLSGVTLVLASGLGA